jgi:site-specific recombinase XerD
MSISNDDIMEMFKAIREENAELKNEVEKIKRLSSTAIDNSADLQSLVLNHAHINEYLDLKTESRQHTPYTRKRVQSLLNMWSMFSNGVLSSESASEYKLHIESDGAKRKLSPHTTFHKLSAVRDFCSTMLNTPWKDGNFIQSAPVTARKRTNKNDVMRLVGHLQDECKTGTTKQKATAKRNLVMFQVMFWSGIRIGELVELTEDNINFGDNDKQGDISIVNGKGGKNRTIDIHPQLWHILKEYIKTDTIKNSHQDKHIGNIFPVDKARVSQIMRKANHKLGLTKTDQRGVVRAMIPAHELRRYLAQDLTEQGMEQVAQNILGHDKISTTRNHYGHGAKSRIEREQFNNVMRKV